MARMIPSVIDPSQSPPGEVMLFNQLRANAPESWTVLHSLDIPKHIRQIEGELDFLILVPGLGVICLEVKSHESAGRDHAGMWRLGHDQPTARSPFKQASDAMHSTRKRVWEHQGLTSVPFVSAVAFPRCQFDVPASEWEPWQVFDESELTLHGVEAVITRIGTSFRRKLAETESTRWFRDGDKEPTAAQCERIVQVLRPTFERSRSPKARRAEIEGEILRYTEDQFEALDAVESNDRIVFNGAAGTGKTFIAIEAARRATLLGQRVLLCCYNRILGGWLANETVALAPLTETGTIHSLMRAIAQPDIQDGAPPEFWATELPEAAAMELIGGHPWLQSFDLAIIDEAQDICTPEYLDVIDLLLKGGLSQGRFLAFGDFIHQSIFTGDDTRGVLNARTSTVSYELRHNCRNRPRIGSIACSAFGADPYRNYRRPDDGVEVIMRTYVTPDDQQQKLAEVIDLMRSERYQLGDIAVLSTVAQGAAHMALRPPHAGWLTPASQPAPAKIRTSTIHAFKGMEATGVIVTDITDLSTTHARQLLYVAATRATDRLAILVHERAVPQLQELILGGTA